MGVDHAFAERHSNGFDAETMGAHELGPPGWQEHAGWKRWWGPDPPFTVVRDFLAAGLVDHMHPVQVPIVLGRGARLWDGLQAIEEDYDVEAASPPSGVTHLTFGRRPVA
ncbi:hypothetical protein [Aquipuribacter sp. MA13-6]|uniref:hypothetical protein n=1 Tax=unclassified Aquipuribacter TaxID=2635084 RepID=UPI003EEB8738